MSKDIATLSKFHIRKKGFSLKDTGFHVLDENLEDACYAVIPDLKLTKQVVFYSDETKSEKLFWIKQDKIFFATTAQYTMFFEEQKPVAIYVAELKENLIKRNVKILTLTDDSMCNLVEKSAFGGLLGDISGAGFVFTYGKETLGDLKQNRKQSNEYILDLVVEVGPKIDPRIALGAAIILYGRVI